MNQRLTTRERILTASRRLFNRKGYAATTLTEIAKEVGISQGNLTYHFPTKRELVAGIDEDARETARGRLASLSPGSIADDYVAHLLFAMHLTWENRFLLRDRAQYEAETATTETDSDLAADFDELHSLLRRIRKAGMFRRDVPLDLAVLTRSLWIVSRYWMDHLLEFEGVEEVSWEDQERGIQHHFAVLLPYLLASARSDFEEALERLSERRAAV